MILRTFSEHFGNRIENFSRRFIQIGEDHLI